MSARRTSTLIFALALRAAPTPAETLVIDPSLRVGPVPSTPGAGVPVRWVHGYFAGFPFHIEDARDLLDERALIPAFETWCGTLPHIDVGNRSNADSLGRAAPSLLCAPFLNAEETAPVSCRQLPGVPSGRYWRNGGAAMRARGALAVRAPGVFTFAWGHDDGVSFRIGPTRVYEFPDGTGARVDVATVRFEAAGLYPFTLEWFDGIGGAILDWYVTPGERRADEFSNFTFALVPTADLYPLDGRDCTSDCRSCTGLRPLCDRATSTCVACLDDASCGPCSRCDEGACVADPEGIRCPRDAGPEVAQVDDAGEARDAGASVDASTPVTTSGGCGCRTAPRAKRPPLLAILLALSVGWRRVRR